MTTREQWRNSIRPRIETAQKHLRDIGVTRLVSRSGGSLFGEELEFPLFATPLRITVPGFVVQTVDGVNCPEETQILLLDYLCRSVNEAELGSKPNRWIGFQELPDGAFYAKAFRSYTSDPLLRDLVGDVQAFRFAAEAFGGTPFALGDAAFAFNALPKIRLAIVWWADDDEFPANASVLFDSESANALPTDGFAALGRLLCRGLLATAMIRADMESRTIDTLPEAKADEPEKPQ